MKKVRLVFLAILPLLITACSTPRGPAPVVERTPPPRTAEPARPATGVPAAPRQQAEKGFYIVKRGDTLLQIALEFGQNYRDLVAWNNLANPNDIKVDQVLRVLPPDAPSGAQTAAVTPGASVEVRPLPPPTSGNTIHKSAPRGEKRPYSEAVLADMNKQEMASLPPAGARQESARQ